MKIGLTVELMSPRGSVAFQSQAEIVDETIRHVRKDLDPGQEWIWRVQIPRDSVGVLAMQAMDEAEIHFNGTSIVHLEGQKTTDFGIVFLRRGAESFGTLPFDGDLSEIRVVNVSGKKNRVDAFIGESPE